MANPSQLLSVEALLCELAFLRGGGRAKVGLQLERALGPLEDWWPQRSEDQMRAVGLRGQRATALSVQSLDEAAKVHAEQLHNLGFIALRSSLIPGFSELPEPPRLVFVRGDLFACLDAPMLAVVGARNASAYGRRIAEKLSTELSVAGVTIVSGLARGVDAAAHRGALNAHGKTVAVLGCGGDVVYPPEHRDLHESIAASGALITEYLPGTMPKPHHFPRRNRLVVALSQALLVVEARIKSGTLTSVRWAADLGREVLVVPGHIDSPLQEGPMELLREGATPVGSFAHVLQALGLDPDVLSRDSVGGIGGGEDEVGGMTRDEQRLCVLLAGGGLTLDELVRASGEPPGRTLTLLLGLEIRGAVQRSAGDLWCVAQSKSG